MGPRQHQLALSLTYILCRPATYHARYIYIGTYTLRIGTAGIFYLFIIIFFTTAWWRPIAYSIIYDAYNVMSSCSTINGSEFVLYIILDHVRGHERLTFTLAHTHMRIYSDHGPARVMEKYISIHGESLVVYCHHAICVL